MPVNVPRAPKSHTGVPSPSRAGTNQTSPVSSQPAATAAESAASSMIPRSSRSHSTQVPADSMMASIPQVTAPAAAPGDDRDGPGRSPDGLGRSVGSEALVEHAAGAEGGLGLTGPVCSSVR